MPIPGEKARANGQAPASQVVPNARSNQLVPAAARNALTNRGGAGLLKKLTDADRASIIPHEVPNAPKITKVVAKHRIAPALLPLVIPIDGLIPDPMNARVHPDDNMEAIKLSLTQYGQLKPIVVQKETNIIVAGNGTYAAAKALGWPDIAATVTEMSKVEASGYGLADNRTAELAKWDMKAFRAHDLLLQEAGHTNVGWSADELMVLRAAEWIEPVIDPNASFGANGNSEHKLILTEEQKDSLTIACGVVREREGSKELSDGDCLKIICDEWLIPPTEGE